VVTHDQEEALSMAGRVAVMNAGKVAQLGSPRAVYEHPQNRFVADFVGTINLFDATVLRAEAGGAVLGTAVGELVVAQPLAVGAAVCLGVRPEKLLLSRAPLAAGLNRLRGVIQDVAYLGGLSSYHVRLGDGTVIRASAPNLERRAGVPLAVGDEVHVGWRPDAGVVLAP